MWSTKHNTFVRTRIFSVKKLWDGGKNGTRYYCKAWDKCQFARKRCFSLKKPRQCFDNWRKKSRWQIRNNKAVQDCHYHVAQNLESSSSCNSALYAYLWSFLPFFQLVLSAFCLGTENQQCASKTGLEAKHSAKSQPWTRGTHASVEAHTPQFNTKLRFFSYSHRSIVDLASKSQPRLDPGNLS